MSVVGQIYRSAMESGGDVNSESNLQVCFGIWGRSSNGHMQAEHVPSRVTKNLC
jgi:hypothetical protein